MKSYKWLTVALILSLALITSCAGIFSGMRSSSVKEMNKAPYYDGKKVAIDGKVGLLPAEYDIRLYRAFFEDDRKAALEPLLDEIDAFAGKFDMLKPMSIIDLDPEQAPDIYMGNVDAFNSPTSRTSSGEDEDKTQMVLYRYAPSKAWKDSLLARAAQENVDYFLYITVGFGEYFLRMKNLLGSKELQLGTGNSEPSKWLSDLDAPADVLQVTGALLDKNGKILRCGAEGIIAKKTGFLKSLIDVQDLISDAEIAKLLNDDRRADLTGEPLKWEAAVQNLIAQVLNKDDLILMPQGEK